jgi:hypothetical protein
MEKIFALGWNMPPYFTAMSIFLPGPAIGDNVW